MTEPRTQRSRRAPWTQILASLTIVVGAGLLLYPEAASWFAQKEQSRVMQIAMARQDEPPTDDPEYRAAEFERARVYNEALVSGAILESGGHVPVSDGVGRDGGDGAASEGDGGYAGLLNPTGSGFMARLRYDDLGIDLPVYHGTADSTLLRGVGHLQGTSLPVGGQGTRSVLTAHRGLPTATMFDALDRGKTGDLITVTVLGETLGYRVIDTQVIRPEDTESILPVPGSDLITLITCTPLGINSYRIVVTAERVDPAPEPAVLAAEKDPELPGFPWWGVGLGAAVLGAVGLGALGSSMGRRAEGAASAQDRGRGSGSDAT